VHASPQTWATRALWVTLPLTLGDLLADSLDGRSGAVRAVVVVLAWSLWACGLLASLVTRSVALTALRVVAPVPLVAAAVALLRDDVSASAAGWVGAVTAAVVLVLALSAEVGADFIDGDSYGDERRFGLRPPGVLLLGPLPAVWAAVAVPLPVAAMLLAAERWVPGVALAVVGLPAAWWGLRVLHRLSRRCLVFVPAGMTLVDEMALAEPVLLRRRDVTRLGPAPADTTALDLSAGATGLILQVDLDPPVTVVPVVPRGEVAEPVSTGSLLFAPSRPGALLEHASTRRLAVQRG